MGQLTYRRKNVICSHTNSEPVMQRSNWHDYSTCFYQISSFYWMRNSDSTNSCKNIQIIMLKSLPLHRILPSIVPLMQEWQRSYSHVWQCHGLLSRGLLWTEPQLSQRHPPLNCSYTKCESALYSGRACSGVSCGLKQLWHTSNSHWEQWCENLKETSKVLHITYYCTGKLSVTWRNFSHKDPP